MKKISILFLIIFTFLSTTVSAQISGAMNLFGYPRFAKAIRLGDVYTGIAEGTEALFYNPAGIAKQNYYSLSFSNGDGVASLIDDDVSLMDYALIVPLPKNYGTIGFSINTYIIDFTSGEIIQSIYSIHYARQLSNNFAVGLSAGLYSEEMTNLTFYEPDGYSETKDVSASTIDINLSALYSMPDELKFLKNDNFNFGFQFKNLIGSKLKFKFNEINEESPLFQNMRFGLSYNLIPNLKKKSGFYPAQFLFAFDAVLKAPITIS